MSFEPSIAVRLTSMFAVAAFAVFSLVGVVLYRDLDAELVARQVEQVDTRFQQISFTLEHPLAPFQWNHLHARLASFTPPDLSAQYWLLSDDPEIRFGEPPPEVVRAVSQGSRAFVKVRDGKRSVPMIVRSQYFPANDSRAALRFIVGVEAASYIRTRRAFESELLLAGISGVVLVALIGFVIARWGLVSVRRLSEEARRLSPSALSQRLALDRLPAELSDLATSFNDALGRLEGAYQQLEAFNADVTHELRTPLANLIGQTQVALARDRSAKQLTEVLLSNLEETQRIRDIVNDMLFLSRADQGERPQRLTVTSLADEIAKTVEFLDFVTDEAGVSVRIRGDARAPVDVPLLLRAVTNLLQNAIRFSQAGSEIFVDITVASTTVQVAVSNRGPAISPEHLGRLFDRFYRADAARTNSWEHHGLGLAIVKAVAIMHAGNVFASSSDGVTTIGLAVPLVAPPV
jgi:two-component system heavy metal sensor histidine kinase CusS